MQRTCEHCELHTEHQDAWGLCTNCHNTKGIALLYYARRTTDHRKEANIKLYRQRANQKHPLFKEAIL